MHDDQVIPFTAIFDDSFTLLVQFPCLLSKELHVPVDLLRLNPMGAWSKMYEAHTAKPSEELGYKKGYYSCPGHHVIHQFEMSVW